MGVVIKGGCGFHMWSPSNPPFQNPVYGPELRACLWQHLGQNYMEMGDVVMDKVGLGQFDWESHKAVVKRFSFLLRKCLPLQHSINIQPHASSPHCASL